MEFIFGGAGVRADDAAQVQVDRTELRECAFGAAAHGAARLAVARSNFLNNTFGALHQAPLRSAPRTRPRHGAGVTGRAGGAPQGGESNTCRVELRAITVYCCGAAGAWSGAARPATLREDDVEVIDPPTAAPLTEVEKEELERSLHELGFADAGADEEEMRVRGEALWESGALHAEEARARTDIAGGQQPGSAPDAMRAPD